MSAITKYATEALKYAGGEVTVNLRHSTTDLYRVPTVAASERAASPTFIAKTRNTVLDAVQTALQSGQQGAQQLLQKNLAHYSPLAAVAFNSATTLTAKLRATSAMKKAEAVPNALAASIGGFATGLGQQAAASAYELLPIGLRGMAHPQIAAQVSRATNGASTAITDPMRELRQSHEQVSEGLRTLITQPVSVAQHAWATYQNNVLNNSLQTPDDVFRGVKTIADVALVAGPMRALGSVSTRTAAHGGAPSGRTIDLSPQEYWVVREGQNAPATPAAFLPQKNETHVQAMALKAAQSDAQFLRTRTPTAVEPVAVAQERTRPLTPTQLDRIEPGFQFSEVIARRVSPEHRVHPVSDNAIYLEAKGLQESEVFEVNRPLNHRELVRTDRDLYMVFDEKDGLRATEGIYHFARFKEEYGYVTYLDRNRLTVPVLNLLFMGGIEPTQIGMLRFSAGRMVKSNVESRANKVSVPPNSVVHPQANLGGWFSLQSGFYPNRSPSLGTYATVDQLLSSKEILAPGRDGVKVDREIQDDELHRLSLKLGGVEVHSAWADGDYYLFSGNLRTAPSPLHTQHQRIFSSSHNHPGGTFTASNPDLYMAETFYLHTLKSFPFERVRQNTRVVANIYDDVVWSMPFGPRRDVPLNTDTFNASSLGLLGGPEVKVQVWPRPKAPSKGIFRIEVGEQFTPADGKKIRAALLDVAKNQGFGTVTFEVELKGRTSEAFSDLILQLQGDRLIFSMQEPRYDIGKGTYPTSDKIFVWHEDVRDPSKQVSNADVWRGQ